ncbi:MAG: hypothetical protein ACYDBW_11455 [Sulfuricaulis sp.]
MGMARSPSVMIFRLSNETPASVIPRMLSVIQERRKELEEGAIIYGRGFTLPLAPVAG